MIFNTESTSTNLSAVQESPYELGIYGAMMHVYENECNYNMMMKAVGLSEMKYYQENNGAELFVQEAGALKGFADKIKALLKAAIEKIKSIFKKFVAVINSYVASDKDFVKKYQNELLRKDLKDFEFKGYKFPSNLDSMSIKAVDGDVANVSADDVNKNAATYSDAEANKDADAKDAEKAKLRGKIIGKGELDESEFRTELKNMFYGNDGEKDTLESISVREQLNIISNAAANIKAAEKDQKAVIKSIEDMIKVIDKQANEFTKGVTAQADEKDVENKNRAVKALNNRAEIYKSVSNDYTIYFGALVQALKDRNRQAKAICVKALSYKVKNESYAGYSEGGYADLFAGVKIV